jgi:hypothetical protein
VKRLLLLVGTALLAMVVAAPAIAITRGGELDGEDHPYVGLMVAADLDAEGEFLGGWRCSGTLISPTVYVTAGHCTDGLTPGEDLVFVWTESDLEPDPSVYGYPFDFDGEGTSVTGTAYTHPLYVPSAFFLYDLGVVVLDEAIDVDRYATLTDEGAIDEIGHGRKTAVVTAVGYGLQGAKRNDFSDDKTRFQADLFVVNTNGVGGIGGIKLPSDLPPTNSMIVSGDSKHGGTCFGDSGGPALIGDTIVAVNSFGLNANCAGIGGMFRIDRDVELDWIRGFLGS